jgi:hypothetical protein
MILGKHTILASDGTISQTLDWIKRLAVYGTMEPEIIAEAEKIKNNPNILQAVFDYVYNCGVYYPDPHDRQLLKTVRRTLDDKTSNCVNYSIVIASLLLRLGIKFEFRIVGFNSEFEHIYVIAVDPITKKNVVLDCVLGQDQSGKATFENRPKKGQFNKECNYSFKRDISMASLEVLNGIGEIKQGYYNTVMPRCYISRKSNNIHLSGITPLQDAILIVKKQQEQQAQQQAQQVQQNQIANKNVIYDANYLNTGKANIVSAPIKTESTNSTFSKFIPYAALAATAYKIIL